MGHQIKAIHKEIQAAKNQQKRHIDPKRTKRSFKEGNKVFLQACLKISSLTQEIQEVKPKIFWTI